MDILANTWRRKMKQRWQMFKTFALFCYLAHLGKFALITIDLYSLH